MANRIDNETFNMRFDITYREESACRSVSSFLEMAVELWFLCWAAIISSASVSAADFFVLNDFEKEP